jgi:hypothetical protein
MRDDQWRTLSDDVPDGSASLHICTYTYAHDCTALSVIVLVCTVSSHAVVAYQRMLLLLTLLLVHTSVLSRLLFISMQPCTDT